MLQRARARVAAVVVVLLGLGGLVWLSAPAEAAVSQPFAIRKQINDHGDILLRGNSLLTCPTSAATCAAARTGSDGGTPANLNNNTYVMTFVDVDSDDTTASSSSADVSLGGAGVAWAGLYWSGYTSTADTRVAPPAGTVKNQLKLRTPAAPTYNTVTATSVYDGTTTGASFSAFADVTDLVRAGGSGQYTGANIFASTGRDSYAAWTLVIITKEASEPKRNLTVFDGFGVIQNMPTSDNTASVTLSGFQTPVQGTVDAKLGAITYEGDAGLTGDSLTVTPQGGSTNQLSNGLNPATNVFNSTVSSGGTAVPGRDPSSSNTFGYDADVFDTGLGFGNGQTSATLSFTTGGETYFPAVATFSSNIYAPDLSLVRNHTVDDVNSDGRTRPGDRITYTVDVTNSDGANSTDSADTVLTDSLPAGTTYVPGSLRVDGATVTDGTDGDRGEISGSTLTVRLGTSPGSTGGTLVKGATTRVTYTVEITGTYTASGAVTSSSTADYKSPTTSTPYTSSSDTDSVTVAGASADLGVTTVAAPSVVQRDGTRQVTWTTTVRNDGPEGEPAPVLTQQLPAGTTATVSGATCTGGPTYSCNLAALASGASTVVTFAATLPANVADPAPGVATVTGAATDPVSANNSNTGRAGVNTRPAGVADSVPLPPADSSVDADVLANDTDPDGDPLTLQSVVAPAHGTATNVGGKVRYRLTDTAFTGTDTVTYTVCDDRGGCSTAALDVVVADHSKADLTVTHTAAPAVVQRDGGRVVTWTARVTNNGPSPEPSPVLTETLPGGTTAVTVDGATCTPGGVTYGCPLPALAVGASRTVTFTGTLPANAADPAVATAVASGSLTDTAPADNSVAARVAVNTRPVATGDNATLTGTATVATVPVLTNDSDPDGDPLTLTTVSTPAHGTATISAGQLVYTLTDTAFEGDDTVTYTVCDDRSGCTTGTLVVHLADRAHAPVAVADTARTVTGRAVTVPVLANDTDKDGDTLALAKITKAPGHGSVTVVDGKAVYQPAAGYVGTDSFVYQVCDPAGECATATVTVTVTSEPPVTRPDTVTVKPGGTAVVDVTGNDSDPDGDALGDVTIVKQPAAGTAFVDADGKIHYSAPAGGVPGGVVTLTYRTCDDTGACSTGTLTFLVKNSTAGSGSGAAGSSGSGAGNTTGGSDDGNTSGGDDLAFTGAQVWPLTTLAAALLLGGLALLAGARRRRPALSWRQYDEQDRRPSRPR